ncbi:MAG: hypothetical protein LBU28_01800, partial [Spirochaetaceae bacterium]|nr:hypothetical protein [Spirochaetaceae bacterium]
MRKAFMTVLLFCFAFSFFAGCKKQAAEQETGSDPNYPIEISVFTQAQRQQPPADNKFYRLLKEKFNVTIKWDILVGDRNQKRGIMIASGDYPDMIEINETAFIDAGALIPLEDLIEKEAPNVARHYKDGGAW